MTTNQSNPTGRSTTTDLRLEDRSRVAVIGGGPAGSFCSFFLLEMAQRAGVEIHVDIYEKRDFSVPGPKGCNMCGGVVSESLVQTLAAEGINLPSTVVQRGIDSYVLHTDVGSVHIETPLQEKRIAAVHRGAGPRGLRESKWSSFDGYLLEIAMGKGAHLLKERVVGVVWEDGRPQVQTQGGLAQSYDLLVVSLGLNTVSLRLFQDSGLGYKPPRAAKTYVREFCLGQEWVQRSLGNSMHIFLLNLPRLEFAAAIPKGEYVTLCLLGNEIDKPLLESFLDTPEVRQCLPSDCFLQQDFCQCFPKMNVRGAVRPFADRVVFIGDCGVTRLYKDGIGGAYRTAKAAAVTAIFQGISAEHFRRHFARTCRRISIDNAVGKLVFALTRQIQRRRFMRNAVLRMASREKQKHDGGRRMQMVLWDIFTGSSPYTEILVRTLHPAFLFGLLLDMVVSLWTGSRGTRLKEDAMETSPLGRLYRNGQVIIQQGEVGDCMYVIQAGQVEVLQEKEGKEVRLAVLGEGDFFGEMALFDREVRSATVRGLGEVRVLTLDKRTFLRRVHEDPSLAFRMLERMCRRIREKDAELIRI